MIGGRQTFGREAEQAFLAHLVAEARTGKGATTVLTGPAGIGKTRMIEYARTCAETMPVREATGIEPETEVPYAGLHQLLRGDLDRIARLAPAQAEALRSALGLETGSTPDRFLVGAALLSLLSDIASRMGLLCLIDDIQWLDRCSRDALLFVAHRLSTDGIVMVFAARDDEVVTPGIRPLPLGRLSDADSRLFLDDYGFDLAPVAADRVIAEAEGNPLALLELPPTLSNDQRAGRIAPHAIDFSGAPIIGRVQQAFAERIQALPRAVKSVVIAAAFDDSGLPSAILIAARHSGATAVDLGEAERAGIFTSDAEHVAFRHPLMRSAARSLTPLNERIAVHRGLADAFAIHHDADRRAWHLAAATTGPDDEVATELDAVAERARAKGGYATVGTAYERAAALSSHPDARARRLTLAALAHMENDDLDRAVRLAEEATPNAVGPVVTTDLAWIRARRLFEQGRYDEARNVELAAAAASAGERPEIAASVFFRTASVLYHAAETAGVMTVADRLAALALPDRSDVTPYVCATKGFARLLAGDFSNGVPAARGVIGLCESRFGPIDRATLAGQALLVGDPYTSLGLTESLVRDCRENGAYLRLPRALAYHARSQYLAGRLAEAARTCEEGRRVSRAVGDATPVGMIDSIDAQLRAIRGDGLGCHELADRLVRSTDMAIAATGLRAMSLLDLGNRDFESAIARYTRLSDSRCRYTIPALYGLPDHIEAAVRLGLLEDARHLTARYLAWSEAGGMKWMAAIGLRLRALLIEGDESLELLEVAMAEHEANRGSAFEQARTALVYGERLRRLRKNADARIRLRQSLDIFQRFDAAPWVDCAKSELRAAGESVADLSPAAPLASLLTGQELEVARLAATGLSNAEVAQRLFLSPRTVGYHLHKIFPKLGISSRTELASLQFTD